MSDRDVLDKKLLSQFRWRMGIDSNDSESVATETVSERGTAEVSTDASAGSQGGEHSKPSSISDEERAAMLEECKELAQAIKGVWELGAGPHDVEVARLAMDLGLSLVRFGHNHPLEAVRLVRIVLRSCDTLRAACGSQLPFALTWLRLDHPEVIDVVATGVRTRWNRLAFALEQCAVTEQNGARYAEIGTRLAAVMDDTSLPWNLRCRAAAWIAVANSRAIVPALRRALRAPSVPLRSYALYALVGTLGPEELIDDVQFVLDDSVEHPFEARDGRTLEVAANFADQILEAVKVVRPPNGHVPLEAILRGECKYANRRRRAVLDSDGALEALAAGYPERAVVWIDRWLASLSRWKIDKAVRAAAQLPPALARPRLLQGVSIASDFIVDHAKSAWTKMFESECPVDPNGGVEVIAGHAWSDRFASRLVVLRGFNREAANCIAKVLLDEAPDPEALALLAWGWRTDAFGHSPSLPSGCSGWLTTLVEKFGEAGFDACAKVIEGAARVGGASDVLAALAKCAVKSGNPSWIARARECVDLASRAPFESRSHGIVDAIEVLGARESDFDLLWEIACPTTNVRHFADASNREAQRALRSESVRELVAARVTREMEQCKDNWPRLRDVLAVGVRCELPNAIACATEWSRTPWIDDTTRAMARACMMILAHEERLDAEWTFATAATVESPARRNAIDSLLHFKQQDRIVELFALAYQSEDPETTVMGADGLFRLESTDSVGGLDLVRLDACLPHVHYKVAVEFLFLHLWKNKSLVPFEAHYRRLLVGAKSVAMAMADALTLCDHKILSELLDRFASEDLDEEVRETLSSYPRSTRPHETYWQHITDDEEESEFEIDEEEDDEEETESSE